MVMFLWTHHADERIKASLRPTDRTNALHNMPITSEKTNEFNEQFHKRGSSEKMKGREEKRNHQEFGKHMYLSFNICIC